MGPVEHTDEVAGLSVRWRVAGERPQTLYVHGNPTAGWMWDPFLERTGGIAPDLPGFGGSAKPGGFDYTPEGYADFLEAFTAHLGLDRMTLVVHDWGGGIGLTFAQRHPDRIERLVVNSAVPLLPGFRWHRLARLWRTPGVGELTMGLTTRRAARQILRRSNRNMPDAFVDGVLSAFDHGTQRAILRLYRSAPPEVLARAGERLGELRCPALVVWGTRDPYIPVAFADRYAEALGGEVEVEIAEGAGHWWWLDAPELVDRVVGFLH